MTIHPYLFALVDGGGTVTPELSAVRCVVEQGHDVVVLAEETMRDEVLATGASYRPWVRATNRPTRRPEDDPCRDWECKNPMQLFDRMIERQFVGPAGHYAEDVDDAIRELQPAAIVCSFFAFGAMTAAEAADIPFAVLMPNLYPLPTKGVTPFGMGLRPARGPLGRMRDRFLRALTVHTWDRKALPQLNALREKSGLDPLPHYFDQVHRARFQLVMTSAAFDFPADLPPNVEYVGPVLDDASWSEPWSPPNGHEPLVLVALSSTFQDQTACLQRVVDALETLPVQAVVTTGPALDPGAILAAPNVTVVRSAPHRAVLEHAAIVVNHGGHGTVVKALAAGVPMVVLPHGRDQGDNAARVVARGAGVSLKRTASSDSIASAIARVLADESFASNARLLGNRVVADAQRDDLGRLLEALARVPTTA